MGRERPAGHKRVIHKLPIVRRWCQDILHIHWYVLFTYTYFPLFPWPVEKLYCTFLFVLQTYGRKGTGGCVESNIKGKLICGVVKALL